MDKESRNAFIVAGASLGALLVIGLVFSGRPGDAIYAGPPIHQRYQVEEVAEAPVDEVAEAQEDEVEGEDVAEASEEEAPAEEVAEASEEEALADEVAEAPEEEAPAEEVAEAPEDQASAEEVAEAPAEEAPAEETAEAPEEEVPAEEVAEAPEEEAPAEEVAFAGDAAAGERVFRQCQACHQVGEGAQNRVGPVLNDIIDRPKGGVEGFRYSNALQARGEAGEVWGVEEMRAFLANPRGYLPGTTMAFAGLRNESDIDDVIAYLYTFE